MRYLFILLLFACSPDRDLRQGEPEISFDLNGTHYSHTGEPGLAGGAWSTKIYPTSVSSGSYIFVGMTNQINEIQFIVHTDSLKAINYTLKQGFGILVNGVVNTTLNNDSLILNISSYRDGIVNGTFSGKITEAVSQTPLVTRPATVTNGKIKDVRVRF